ncbi:hypothetical protein [uncultured Tenacibaculum sp.]|uniref:hypothetical protein n=1 Tax=uncultured Tenacibaculum sp. TaxID=174713 RepID=UPI002628E8A7|nr:hypothetical protein [uncultured Tenacibaculum sp.]
MKKKLFVLLILFVKTVDLRSQNDHLGKIFFRNGTQEVVNYKWVTSTNVLQKPKIKFTKKNGVFVRNGFNEIEKIRKYHTKDNKVNDSTDYYFKSLDSKILTLRSVISKGKLRLYAKDHSREYNSSFVFGTINGSSSYQTYYVAPPYSVKVTKLPKKIKSKKFKKILSKYTSKCKPFTEKLNDKKFLENKSVKDIINYYNENCK